MEAWREGGYPGATQTTLVLLNHWFQTDHRSPNGRKLEYHSSQRHAIETLIYLYEVTGVRRHKALVERYATATPNLLCSCPEVPIPTGLRLR